MHRNDGLLSTQKGHYGIYIGRFYWGVLGTVDGKEPDAFWSACVNFVKLDWRNNNGGCLWQTYW
jgi:hypothetical protein